MPTYDFQCNNEKCAFEFEDFLSRYTAPSPPCPKCKCEDVVRLITGTVRGRVELTGQELKQSVKEGAQALKRKAAKNESFLANLVGENKYHNDRKTGK